MTHPWSNKKNLFLVKLKRINVCSYSIKFYLRKQKYNWTLYTNRSVTFEWINITEYSSNTTSISNILDAKQSNFSWSFLTFKKQKCNLTLDLVSYTAQYYSHHSSTVRFWDWGQRGHCPKITLCHKPNEYTRLHEIYIKMAEYNDKGLRLSNTFSNGATFTNHELIGQGRWYG